MLLANWAANCNNRNEARFKGIAGSRNRANVMDLSGGEAPPTRKRHVAPPTFEVPTNNVAPVLGFHSPHSWNPSTGATLSYRSPVIPTGLLRA